MKKKFNRIRQLQRIYVIKLIVFILFVVVVGVATCFMVYGTYDSKAVKVECDSFKSEVEEIGESVAAADSFKQWLQVNDTSAKPDSVAEAELGEIVVKICNESNGGYYYIVYKYSQNKLLGQGGNSDIGTILNISGEAVPESINYRSFNEATFGEKTYILHHFDIKVSSGANYGVCCVRDFTSVRNNANSILNNTIAYLVCAFFIILGLAFAYTYSVSGRERPTLFKYKLRLNKTGRITSSNTAFKRDFPLAYNIPSPENFDRNNFTMVNLTGFSGESSTLALRVIGRGDKIKVCGGVLTNASNFVEKEEHVLDKEGLATNSLARLFDAFIQKGKRTLLGIFNITALERIRTLFGKQMALDIQQLIIKKIKEKFGYAYELDFGLIGVAFPDGKNLDILVTDMEQIFRYIDAPIRIDDNLFTLDTKAGFAMCDQTMRPLEFEYCFKAARAAEQRAIEDKNIADFIIYHESQRKLYAKYFIKYDIKQMLAEGAFEMEYQPQYNIQQRRVEGFEALFRVKKSWNVNVDTFSFITYAERTGAMVQLGDFIFDTGMAFAKSIEGKDVSVSLNVSPVQLMQAGFIENFLGLYKKYDLQPGSICVEITESFLMTNFTETLRKLEVLTSRGIKVHLDDFGTEYSSLLYIKKLPISTIKIDKEFVKDVLVSSESQAIIKFITGMARLLNGTTICEGVETVPEFDMLNFLGCDTIQGWLISKSLKDEAARKFIDTFDYSAVEAAYKAKTAPKA